MITEINKSNIILQIGRLLVRAVCGALHTYIAWLKQENHFKINSTQIEGSRICLTELYHKREQSGQLEDLNSIQAQGSIY